MQSFTHPLHSGAVAALSSAAPSSSRAPPLPNQPFGLGFRSRGDGFRLRTVASSGGVGFGIAGLGSRGSECARFSSRACGVFVMHRLVLASQRRIQVDSKASRRPCLACRSSSGSRNSSGEENYEERPPQDAVLKAISEVSKSEGRVGKTTNLVIGGTVKKDSESEWNAIDQKVNVYPMVRDFTAIGTGGDAFVQAMVQAVESITDARIPKVTKKLSSQGKYVSVKIGGVTVESSDQVRAVYDAMRKDVRLKYFL